YKRNPGVRNLDYGWPAITKLVPDITFDFADEVYGGDLTVWASAIVNGRLIASDFVTGYKILGYANTTQESDDAVTLLCSPEAGAAALTNSTLRKIASWESGAYQFDENGYPLWSSDTIGVGVMQYTVFPDPFFGWPPDADATV